MSEQVEQTSERMDLPAVRAAAQRVTDKPRDYLEKVEKAARDLIVQHDRMTNSVFTNNAWENLRHLLDMPQP